MASVGAAELPLAVSVLDSDEGFGALRAEWQALLERAREASPFLSWHWQQAWWRAYGRGRSLRLYVARSGERLVGLVPLYRQDASLGFGLRYGRLRFVGTGGDTSPDHLAALLAPEDEEGVARRLVDAVLAEPRWDVLWLSDVREGSTLASVLIDAARERRLPTAVGPPTPVPFVPLTTGWERLLERLGAKGRKNLRRERRHIEQELGGRFFVWQDPEGLDRAFDRLAALHRLRWEGRAPHSFSSPEYLAFHREVMRRFLERGWLRLFCLEIGSELVAMLYCFRFRDEVFHFQGGFDPAYARFGPGFVLMGYALEHSIDEGAVLFDLLKGEYPHKEIWSPESRVRTHLRVYRRTLPGLLRLLRERELPAMKRRLGSLLGERGAG
jgi:CelD/BcsL family acetyltransferase involved in cellulose biosynthesis